MLTLSLRKSLGVFIEGDLSDFLLMELNDLFILFCFLCLNVFNPDFEVFSVCW